MSFIFVTFFSNIGQCFRIAQKTALMEIKIRPRYRSSRIKYDIFLVNIPGVYISQRWLGSVILKLLLVCTFKFRKHVSYNQNLLDQTSVGRDEKRNVTRQIGTKKKAIKHNKKRSKDNREDLCNDYFQLFKFKCQKKKKYICGQTLMAVISSHLKW